MTDPTSSLGSRTPAPTAGPETHRDYERVADAIPDPEPLRGARSTYPQGEVASIGGLIGDISENLSALMRQEVALARAELQESAGQAGRGAGMLGGAGVAGHLAALFASLALAALIAHWLDSPGWAALIVAVLWGVVAAILAAQGRTQLKKVTGMRRTVETAKKVPDALKGNEEHA